MENRMSIEKVEEFLRCVDGSTEPAALITTGATHDKALKVASDKGYAITEVYEAAIDLLGRGERVAITVSEDLPRDIYDLLRQYSHRRGIIQVLPKEGKAPALLQLDTEKTKLLIVIPAEQEAKQATRYPELFDLIGMVERL
jgi:hypothetical protein